MDFINTIAPLAEAANHHPDILLHGYKNVRISMFTHSKNAITDKDYDLAKQIDKIIE